MNLHEYQAKNLFQKYGIPVPAGKPAHSVKEALRNASEFETAGWVVKAQVHAGGRGKAGGVKITKSQDELEQVVRNMLGSRLITKQSAPNGQPVNCVLIQGVSEIKAEFYLSMLVDRSKRRIGIIASRAGGMDIEEVAATEPDKIINIPIDPIMGVQNHHVQRIAFALDLSNDQKKEMDALLKSMYRLFTEKDLSLIEINPLIIDGDDHLSALDAKVSVDDNALFRQVSLEDLRDASQEDEKEHLAKRFDLNYITLDGDIACMVNGAGLAMATMDIIKLHGGDPANFLDVGGGATAERVAEAFKLIVSDENVKAILVNIFGGIVRCDLIAEGIIQGVKEVGVNVPVVVRLEGTNVDEGKKILAESDLAIIPADNLNDAADKAVAASKGGS